MFIIANNKNKVYTGITRHIWTLDLKEAKVFKTYGEANLEVFLLRHRLRNLKIIPNTRSLPCMQTG